MGWRGGCGRSSGELIGALRYVLSGGAPLAVETLREAEAEAAFGVPVREAYGLSESCGPVCFLSLIHI